MAEGLPLPGERPQPAWDAGHRARQIPQRHLRERLLLARARGLPEVHGPRKEKVARNRERDLLNNQRLESIAWGVITVWECELDKAHLPDTIDRVEAELQANKAKWEAYSQRRREDRQFALEQARKRREIAALVAAELSEQLDTPVKFRKITYDDEY